MPRRCGAGRERDPNPRPRELGGQRGRARCAVRQRHLPAARGRRPPVATVAAVARPHALPRVLAVPQLVCPLLCSSLGLIPAPQREVRAAEDDTLRIATVGDPDPAEPPGGG